MPKYRVYVNDRVIAQGTHEECRHELATEFSLEDIDLWVGAFQHFSEGHAFDIRVEKC